MQTISPLLFSAICPAFTANYHQQIFKFQDHLPAMKRKFRCLTHIKGVFFIRTQSTLTKPAAAKFKVLPDHNFNVTSHTYTGRSFRPQTLISFQQKRNKKSTQVFEHNFLKTCRTTFMLYSLVRHIIHQRIRVNTVSTTTMLKGQVFAGSQT